VTVEQVADAVDVSTRTFFNYFASKEEALIGHDPDAAARLRDALAARPVDESPLEALGQALSELALELAGRRDQWLARRALIGSDPRLLAAHLAAWAALERALVEGVAQRTRQDPEQDLYPALVVSAAVSAPRVAVMRWHADDLSWHWIFYINLPLGVIALAVTAAVLPSKLSRVHHVIDYLGALLIALAATALVLLTSLGGTTYGWGSAPIILLGVAGLVLIVAFLVVERRAAEPMIPLKLFANRVFSARSAIGFVVGFAMFGAITFLPLFLQIVKEVNPTVSGLRILPMMAGLLITSIGSGLLITRFGRYKLSQELVRTPPQ
jgi:AcrR family transcriptional regulator